VLAATAFAGTTAGAQTDDDAAERAAREISEARERANQAAEDYFAAESRLQLLALDQERLREDLAELEIEVAELRKAVETVAVDRFVASGASGIPILTDLRDPTDQLHGGVLADVATQTGATTLDDYEEAKRRLSDKRRQLDDSEREIERQQAELLVLQAEAEAEVERLREIESQRLEDEAVQIALAAQQREEARQLAELERRQAEANRVMVDAATVGAQAAVDDNVSGNQGASGGDVGGRTGGGGPGNNPRAHGTGYIDPFIVCPMGGPSGYGDTWGAPRSGGRRHQGVDMIAPTGTPLHAVDSGWVSHTSNRLGGITISLLGDRGNRYYYAHLAGYEGVPGYVTQGQVIGFVGDTGNATGIPHLHFEIRPGGGIPVNPYPSVLAAGC
jgi:murein DD-endopeptidase MepM/ murein hydrolase activator NlpD